MQVLGRAVLKLFAGIGCYHNECIENWCLKSGMAGKRKILKGFRAHWMCASQGKVKPSYFNAEWLPNRSAIFMTENAKVPFTSLAFKEQYNDGTQLYKVGNYRHSPFLHRIVATSILTGTNSIHQDAT